MAPAQGYILFNKKRFKRPCPGGGLWDRPLFLVGAGVRILSKQVRRALPAPLLAAERGLGEVSLAQYRFEGSGRNLFSAGGNNDGQNRIAIFAVLDVASLLGNENKSKGFEGLDDLRRRIQLRHG